MKNKKFTYLLTGLVAIIWGFFFYMLFSDNTPTTEQQVNTFVAVEAVEDTIAFQELNLAYKDPFLARKIVSSGYININQSLSKSTIKPKPQKPAVKKPSNIFVWPKVVYGGTLNGEKGLLTLNNEQLIAEEGKQINDFKIVNIYPDSIRIAYKEKTKVFFKNQ
jgi:hypothetical protein